MIDAILFDMDGVLVDSEPVILEAAITGLREYGIDPVPEDFRPFIGTGEDRFIGGVAEKYGLIFKPEMKKRVYDIYDTIVNDKIVRISGVNELIDYLSNKGKELALASSADLRKIKANLSAACIRPDHFKVIVSGEDVKNKKPSPDIYLETASRLGRMPRDCIVIEDAVNGIRSAHSAGMRCIALTTSFPHALLSAEDPLYICRDLYGVLDFFDRLTAYDF